MPNNISRRDFLNWSAAGAATLGLAGCGLGGSSSSSSGKTGSLSIGMKGSLTTLTPIALQGYIWSQMMGHTLYDALIRISADGKLIPHVAESWDVTSPTVTIIKIRPGIVFKTGDALTAKDVAYSIAVRSDPALVAQTSSRPAMTGKQWVKAEVIDPHTVKITTTERVAILTQPQPILIVPENAFTKFNLSTTDVGSGPFQLVKFTSGTRIEMKANPKYWNGVPKLDKLSFSLFNDVASEALNLKSGQVDGLYDVAALHLKEVSSVPKKKTTSAATYATWWPAQMGKPPLNNVEVRKALRYCFDIDLLNKSTFSGTGKHSWNPFNFTTFKSGVEATGITYDPAKAKSLLAAAGATDITVPLLGLDSYEDSIIQGQIIQQGLQAAGVKSTFKAVPASDWVKATYTDGSWEGLFFNAGNMPYPTGNFFDYLVNPAVVKSAYTSGSPLPKVGALYDKVQAATDADIADLLKQAQQSLIDDCPAYFMFGAPVSLILPETLKGVSTNGFGDVFWEKASF